MNSIGTYAFPSFPAAVSEGQRANLIDNLGLYEKSGAEVMGQLDGHHASVALPHGESGTYQLDQLIEASPSDERISVSQNSSQSPAQSDANRIALSYFR